MESLLENSVPKRDEKGMLEAVRDSSDGCSNLLFQPKVVVHIDAEGTADPVPFGMGGPGAGGAPYVVIRVQPLAGELCRFSVSSCNDDDEREEDIVHSPSIPARIVQTSTF